MASFGICPMSWFPSSWLFAFGTLGGFLGQDLLLFLPDASNPQIYRCFQSMGDPSIAGWLITFIKEHLIKMDDWGIPPFQETTIWTWSSKQTNKNNAQEKSIYRPATWAQNNATPRLKKSEDHSPIEQTLGLPCQICLAEFARWDLTWTTTQLDKPPICINILVYALRCSRENSEPRSRLITICELKKCMEKNEFAWLFVVPESKTKHEMQQIVPLFDVPAPCAF